jgi:hypothetical protein
MIKCFTAMLGGVLLLAMVTVIQPVYAEPKDKLIIRNDGVFANANWHEERIDGVTVDTLLFVSEHDKGTDIFIEILVFDPDGLSTGQLGYVFTTENVFDISKKLKTATLSPIELELCIFDEITAECVPSTFTLEAHWTGIGESSKTKTKDSIKGKDFRAKFSETTLDRQAIATGSLGGSDLGESKFADLGRFKTVEMISG